MKKLSIFLLGALGMLAATSCAEKIDPATPQSNPQEPIFEAKQVTTAKDGATASTGVLNLESYRADNATVPVVKLVSAEDLPAGATVSYKFELSNTEDFKKVITLACEETTDGVYVVNAQEWNEAHLNLFGKSPKVKTAYYRVPAYVNVDGSDYRLNSVDYYAISGTIQETCMDAGFTISSAYYFLSDATSWALGDATAMEPFKFEHSDADVYDDPVFVFKFKLTDADFTNADGTTKDGIYWKIASQEAMDASDWSIVDGPEENGDENLSGMLVDKNAQAGKLTEVGTYKLTINMEEMTYDFELLLQAEYLYTPGGANGWNHENSAYLRFTEAKAGYYGLMPVDANGFKICTENNWNDPTTFGAVDTTPALAGELFCAPTGQNIMVATPGLYWIKVSYDPQTYEPSSYELTQVTTVGMIGSMNGWGGDELMTSTDDGATWTADVTFAAGDEFKFRFNGDWAYNYGGDLSNLVFDAGNLKVAEAGTYTVTLKLQPGLPTATMVKK